MNSFMGQIADPFDPYGHDIAGPDRADAGRRPGRDDVARQQRHHRGDEPHEMVHRKDQLARVRRLAPLAVDERLDGQRTAVVSRQDAGPDRGEGVEPLGAGELHVPRLQFARGHVVDARDAEDVIERPAPRHPVRPLADHHAELRLMVDPSDARRNPDGVPMPDHRRRRLEEEHRLGRQRLLLLGGVVPVIQSDTDDLRGGLNLLDPLHRLQS
jgi:hypothetical protein